MRQRLGKGISRALLLFLNGDQFFNHLQLAPLNNISLLSFNNTSCLEFLLAQEKNPTEQGSLSVQQLSHFLLYLFQAGSIIYL